MKLRRAFFFAALFGMSIGSGVPARAQGGGLSGFDRIHAGAIQSNARTGDFTIPSPFSASRRDVDISGDRASGNATSKFVTIDGHVVVHIAHSVSLTGEATGAAKGPSTLRCDHLEIDAESKHYHATGNVRYLQGSRSMDAQSADFDEANNQLLLDGNVSVAGTGKSGVAGGFDSLQTARITSNSAAGDFTIPGHFHATRQGAEISADRANGNTRENRAWIIGHVVVSIPKRSGTLTCDQLEIDGAHRVYHAIGSVRYVEPSREATADKADVDERKHLLRLRGNAHVTDTSSEKK